MHKSAQSDLQYDASEPIRLSPSLPTRISHSRRFSRVGSLQRAALLHPSPHTASVTLPFPPNQSTSGPDTALAFASVIHPFRFGAHCTIVFACSACLLWSWCMHRFFTVLRCARCTHFSPPSQMSVITATSPNLPNTVATTSHHQEMARNSISSSTTSVNGTHRSAPPPAFPSRRTGAQTIESNRDHASSLPPGGSSDRVSQPHILKLANEQLFTILDYLEDDPNKSISFDRRAYLSQESFRPPPPPSATRAQDLGNWRRTCKRFSEIGAEHQFARVTTRFSLKEFDRLDKIASSPHLASAVRKFSYMVPYFYVDGKYGMALFQPVLTLYRQR